MKRITYDPFSFSLLAPLMFLFSSSSSLFPPFLNSFFSHRVLSCFIFFILLFFFFFCVLLSLLTLLICFFLFLFPLVCFLFLLLSSPLLQIDHLGLNLENVWRKFLCHHASKMRSWNAVASASASTTSVGMFSDKGRRLVVEEAR